VPIAWRAEGKEFLRCSASRHGKKPDLLTAKVEPAFRGSETVLNDKEGRPRIGRPLKEQQHAEQGANERCE
jgi:hypothetical protein